MATTKKIETVNELTEKVKKAKAIILADYTGIKHKQLEELRKSLKKSDAELVVSKNRLLARALGDKAAKLEASLTNATASLFSYADEVAPLKELLKFFKAAGMGKTKTGLLGETVLSETEVIKLSTLPTKETLYATLAARLKGPLFGLHYSLSWNLNKLVWSLNAVKTKKTN